MENHLPAISFKLLNEIAFRHTQYMYRSAVVADKGGKISIPHLETLLSASPDTFYETLIETFGTIKIHNSKTTDSCVTPLIPDSFVIWGRMYVIAYYALYNDNFWRNIVLPRMLSLQPNKAVLSEMVNAAQFIDDYYKEQQKIKAEMLAATAQKQEELSPSAENEQLKKRITELEQQVKKLEEQIRILTQDTSPRIKNAGRPALPLFNSPEIEMEQKDKVIAFLKSHNLSSHLINCEKDSTLNKYLASIYWRWQDLGLVSDKPLPTAYYTFLKGTCHLSFSVVGKTFSNRMGEILKHKEKYPDIWGDVCEKFQNNSFSN